MKLRIRSIMAVALLLTTISLRAQTISPGKQTIDKQEYFGLNLNQNIPEKYLSKYWESYLDRFGKVKSKRGIYSIEKASIPSVSNAPVQLTSQINSGKDLSQVFLALYVNGQYVTNASDDSYKNAESILKDFSDYAGVREEARVADEIFTSSEKNYQKQTKDNENTAKEIEKTERKLIEMRAELEKKKLEADNSLIDLQNKQKTLEAARSRVK
ncbi:hypothetical protein L0657_03685 [Dyadobacter sp. CY345]|uniref:hypothetical protein n=1 Tax=Dyadobacter sp. CY345 TaxID=2909335 RepID=UPI001F328F3A|nr:hypothetical protein [Dyadobacter sp. CY345]MCF2443047.1 hypothetical protein [Dyadobacter sp. CY345]